jgi:hypothetical protein
MSNTSPGLATGKTIRFLLSAVVVMVGDRARQVPRKKSGTSAMCPYQ